MRLGTVEREMLNLAASNAGRLMGPYSRFRGAQRSALRRLADKGLMAEIGGVWFATDAGMAAQPATKGE